MSDLIGNSQDRFSRVMAHMEHTNPILSKTKMSSFKPQFAVENSRFVSDICSETTKTDFLMMQLKMSHFFKRIKLFVLTTTITSKTQNVKFVSHLVPSL